MGSFFLYIVSNVLIVTFFRGFIGVCPSGECELQRTWHGRDVEGVDGGDNCDEEDRLGAINGLTPDGHMEETARGHAVLCKRRVEERNAMADRRYSTGISRVPGRTRGGSGSQKQWKMRESPHREGC